MPDQTIHDEMLGDMRGMRHAVGQRFKWYCHVTLMQHAESIRKQGLLPRADATPSEVVVKHAGADSRNIICLNPLGSDMVGPPVQQGQRICVAVCREDLPMRIGLDWSFPETFKLAEVLRSECSARGAADIFVECAKRGGSIVCYDRIPATALRAYAQGCAPHDISRWPMLVSVGDERLQPFA